MHIIVYSKEYKLFIKFRPREWEENTILDKIKNSDKWVLHALNGELIYE